jgi:hypothetical protein
VGNSALLAVWGTSPNDVYVVGTEPAVILHSHDAGTSWKVTTLPADAQDGLTYPAYWDVTGTSSGDVYVVGNHGDGHGVIYHSTGDDVWTEETIPQNPGLMGAWAAPNGEVYAVGFAGTILHYAP